MESWVGPVYFVIFSYWGGPVPYLELFGGGPVKWNTLYVSLFRRSPNKIDVVDSIKWKLQYLDQYQLPGNVPSVLIDSVKEREEGKF